MIASEWNALRSPNNKVLGHNGVLNRDDEIGLPSPSAIGDMAAWYDATDFGSMVMDASANVSLLSDVSGQSGAVSGDSYLELPGVTGAYASTPDSAALSITGDIDIRVDLAATDWTPAVDMPIVSKYETTASYLLRMEATTGNLRLFWIQADGTSINKTSTAAPAFSDHSRGWIRATLDVDNGSTQNEVKFYTSSDGVSWAQLGSTVTTAGVTNIRDQTSVLQIGAQGADEFIGSIYRAQIYNGIDGTLAFNADFTNRGASNQSFPESSSNAALVTINGSARITHLDTENCLVLPGVALNDAYATKYIPGAGVFRVEQRVKLTSYTSRQGLVNVYNSIGNQGSWHIELAATTGFLTVNLTSDGGVGGLQTVVADAALTSATEYWAAEIDLANGTLDFEKSTDGTTWVALGTPQTFTPLTLFDSNQLLRVGSLNAGTAIPATGIFYSTKLYFNGTLVRNFDATSASKLAASFVAPTTGETWTLAATAIALPARIHGARDLYMGTAASQPKYLGWSGTNYGYLNGVAGNYFITPSAPGNRITGNIEIVTHNKLDDWSSVTQSLFTKLQNAGQYCYQLYLTGGGFPVFRYSTNGTALVSATSSNGVPFSNGAEGWLKVSYDATSGDTKFYQGTDGTNWTQLGTTQTIASGAIFDGTDSVKVGTFVGLGYYASVANAISGTPLTSNATPTQVFQASDYPLSGGSTFASSATGETWTINGGATIVDRTGLYFDGTNDYLKSAAFSLSQPENIYLVGEQVTWTAARPVIDGNTNDSMELYQNTTEPNITQYAGTNSATNTAWLVKTHKVITSIFNGASSGVRDNLNAIVTGNAGTRDGNGVTIANKGGAGASTANIFASEILIYDTTAHDTNTQNRLVRYLARKESIDI